MKTISGLLLLLVVAGCRQNANSNNVNKEASDISGAFITNYVPSTTTLRIKGKEVTKADGDNMYNVTGTVEGFSSFNMPVNIEHFSETLQYLGGDPKDTNSWKCYEIYVGKRKLK
jgi:hypothetical protein